MSQSEILKAAHQTVGIPGMIVCYVSFVILFLISGLALIDYKNSDAGKFIIIWAVGSLLSLVALVLFCSFPDSIQSIVNFWEGMFR